MSKPIKYEDLQEVVYVIDREEYPPSIIASRECVINNTTYIVIIYMDGPDDHHVEICDSDGVVWDGETYDMEEAGYGSPDDILTPESLWSVDNEKEIIPVLEEELNLATWMLNLFRGEPDETTGQN